MRRNQGRRRSRHGTVLVALSLLCLLVLPRQDFAEVQEQQLKVVYVYNFAKFITWPEGQFRDEQAPVVVGIYGENPYADSWDVIRGKQVGGRNIMVRKNIDSTEFSDIHILFISRSEKRRLTLILQKLIGLPVLTVSDMDDFTERGGMIQLFQEGGKIRFKINTTAAKKANLIISSKLLNLAREAKA